MLRNRSLSLATFLALALIGSATRAASADDFFKGKTISFVVGFAAGGGFDTYTRLIARHFGKHVPGNPSTLVENRTGAGSLIAANYIYNKAKPNGLTIGNFIGPLVLQHVMGSKQAHFDGRKFGWLGIPVSDSGVCALTKASGITNVDQWFSAKTPVKIGATGPGSTTDDPPKLLKAALKLPIQMVEGYSGTALIRLAAEKGEVAGGCWAWQSIKPTWTKAIESKEVLPILQISAKSHPELQHVPLAISFAKSDQAKQLLKVADEIYGLTARPYSLPPGVPEDRVKMLQKAFMDTLKDPELLAEAEKSQLEIAPVDGPTIAKVFADMYGMDKQLVAELRQLLVPKK